jgi:hypothetical protein
MEKTQLERVQGQLLDSLRLDVRDAEHHTNFG